VFFFGWLVAWFSLSFIVCFIFQQYPLSLSFGAIPQLKYPGIISNG
jgi:hypothetical protein